MMVVEMRTEDMRSYEIGYD